MGNQPSEEKPSIDSDSVQRKKKEKVEYEEEKQLINYSNLKRTSKIVDMVKCTYKSDGVTRLIYGYSNKIEIMNSLSFAVETQVPTENSSRRILTFRDENDELFLLTHSKKFCITVFKLNQAGDCEKVHTFQLPEEREEFFVEDYYYCMKVIPKKNILVCSTSTKIYTIHIPTTNSSNSSVDILLEHTIRGPLILSEYRMYNKCNFVFVDNFKNVVFVVRKNPTRFSETKSFLKLKISEIDKLEELLSCIDLEVSALESFVDENGNYKLVYCWNESSESVRKFISVLDVTKNKKQNNLQNKLMKIEVGCNIESIVRISNDFLLLGGGGRFYTFCPLSTSLLTRWKVTKGENQEETYIYLSEIEFLRYHDHYIEFATFQRSESNEIRFWKFKATVSGSVVSSYDEMNTFFSLPLSDEKERFLFLLEDSQEWMDFEVLLGLGSRSFQIYKAFLT